jgi:hypothetical protein
MLCGNHINIFKKEPEMRELSLIVWLFACGVILTGCSNPSPPIHDSMHYSKLISKPNDNVLYDTIDLQYWLDRSADTPIVVIVSIATSPSPKGQLIGYSCGFKNGKCKYFRLKSKQIKKDIPFIEQDLISSGKVPVYYAVDKCEIAKTTLTFDEFKCLQAAIKNKDFSEAKQIVTKKPKYNIPFI